MSAIDRDPDPRVLLVAADDLHRLRRGLEDARQAARDAEPIDRLCRAALRALPRRSGLRAAIVAGSATELERRVEQVLGWLEEGPDAIGGGGVRTGPGTAFGVSTGRAPRTALLFPGQGAPVAVDGGGAARLVPSAGSVYEEAGLPDHSRDVAPRQVQLAIVASSLVGLRALAALGVEAQVATGHSLGELCALHWAGALDEATLLDAARARGEAMTAHTAPGTMVSLSTDAAGAAELIADLDVAIACVNGPTQTVVSGPVPTVGIVGARASEAGVRATSLAVTGAFHSPLMAPAAAPFERFLADAPLGVVRERVISTVTGEALEPDADLRALLTRQLTDTVRFLPAARLVASEADLLIEVGPGRALTRLVADLAPAAVATRTDDASQRWLLGAVGAGWSAGAPVRLDRLAAVTAGPA